MGLELKKAIEQISKDKGIERAGLIKTLEDAVKSSVLHKYANPNAVSIEVNYKDDVGEIEVYQFKTVVENVENEYKQISLEEALKIDPYIQSGDDIGFRIKVEDLGRVAAQFAKQCITQRMREDEQGLIYNEYKDRIGDIISGTIQRRDRSDWIVNLGKTEAILKKDDQIPREHYKIGDRIQALIKDVRKEGKGPQIHLTRSHRDYMEALFKREVPEVADDTVQIMGIARDPGLRAKVAVFSRAQDIDPVGSCVGVRGARIQNIVQELHGERIDIVVWNPDIAIYARNALAPAVVTRITVDEEANIIEVTVPDDEKTNSIGKRGQNVKLAANLLGWKIVIYTESKISEHMDGRGMESIASVTDISVEKLHQAGFYTVFSLRDAPDDILKKKLGLTEKEIENLHWALGLITPEKNRKSPEDSEKESNDTEK